MNIHKILVIEDEQIFREFLVDWLERTGYEVVGEARTLKEAMEKSDDREIDLVLLDMDLPDGEGMEYIERQVKKHPNRRILVLTAHLSNYPIVKLKKSGVMGVLDKGMTNGKELARAFGTLSNWHTYYPEEVEKAFQSIVRESNAFYKTLSAREQELVKLFGYGMSNEQVAAHLELTVATVQGHRRNVMSKVGVRNTPGLIIWAIQNGFVTGPQIKRRGCIATRD